jgi:hypothetical protein
MGQLVRRLIVHRDEQLPWLYGRRYEGATAQSAALRGNSHMIAGTNAQESRVVRIHFDVELVGMKFAEDRRLGSARLRVPL